MADKSKYSNPQEFSGQVDISGPLTTSGTGTHSGANTFSGDLTSTGKFTHTNASGKYINGKNTVVKEVEFTGSSDEIDSGAIHHPAHILITGITVVVTEALAYGSGTLGIQAGSAAAGTQYMALNADSLKGSASSCAAGKGNSTHTETNTALGGNELAAIDVDAAYVASSGAIHVRLKNSGTAFTDGTVRFIVEFITLEGN
jgi:hypothetical protein